MSFLFRPQRYTLAEALEEQQSFESRVDLQAWLTTNGYGTILSIEPYPKPGSVDTRINPPWETHIVMTSGSVDLTKYPQGSPAGFTDRAVPLLEAANQPQREQSERLARYGEEADARVKARDAQILQLTEETLAQREQLEQVTARRDELARILDVVGDALVGQATAEDCQNWTINAVQALFHRSEKAEQQLVQVTQERDAARRDLERIRLADRRRLKTE